MGTTSDVGKRLGLKADSEKRILETSSVKSVVLKRDRTGGQKELPPGPEKWFIIHGQAGRGLGIV